MSGGAALKPQNWDYILREIKPDVYLCTLMGCTDILGGFTATNFTLPVYIEEAQAFSLGMAVDCFDESGNSVLGKRGELVCKVPFPSQPLGFWNDPDKKRYKETYFSKYPGIWYQGDFCMINPVTKGLLPLGRSDNVLNPGGQRIGSTEIYSVVELLPEIDDTICASRYFKDGDEKVFLFLKLKKGYSFSEELVQKINKKIRENLREAHVPAFILPVEDIPYNTNGKKVEVLVRKAISGEDVSTEALLNPSSIEFYKKIPQMMKCEK